MFSPGCSKLKVLFWEKFGFEIFFGKNFFGYNGFLVEKLYKAEAKARIMT